MYVPNKKRSSGDQINEQWLVNPNSDVADWTFRNDIPTNHLDMRSTATKTDCPAAP